MHTRHGQGGTMAATTRSGLLSERIGVVPYSIEAQVYCLVGFSIDSDWLLRGGQAPRVLAGTREMWCTTPHFAATHSPPAEKLLRTKELRKEVGACKPLVVPLAWPHTRGVGGKDQGHVGKADLL